jgi:hypothetical protein
VAVAREQDVLGLEIAIQDALGMQIRQSQHNFRAVKADLQKKDLVGERAKKKQKLKFLHAPHQTFAPSASDRRALHHSHNP